MHQFMCVLVLGLILAETVYSFHANGKDKKFPKGFSKKCFKERDVTALANQLLTEFQTAFNNNELDTIDDVPENAVTMMIGGPTLLGRQALLDLRHFVRENILDRLELTADLAVQISCNRFYHIETSKTFKDGQLVSISRWLVIWVKEDGKWKNEILMNNLDHAT